MIPESQAKRFELHHELDQTFQYFFDTLATAGLPEGEVTRLAQRVLLARQEALKPLISLDEQEAYQQAYPEVL
jgi:hypothetical protein